MDDLYCIWKLHRQRKINPEQKIHWHLDLTTSKLRSSLDYIQLPIVDEIRKNLGQEFKPS